MRDISDKIYSENENTPFLLSGKPTVCKIMWERYGRPYRPQVKI
jgi:hypothetical protein